MLKLLLPEQQITNNCTNLKCGEIYFITTTTYNVTCCLCASKVAFDDFLQHFQLLHLDNSNEENFNEVDPIKNENKEPLEKPLLQDFDHSDCNGVSAYPVLQISAVIADTAAENIGHIGLRRRTRNANHLPKYANNYDNEDDERLQNEVEQNKVDDDSINKPFPCADCERSYLSRRALWNHRHQHHNPVRTPPKPKIRKYISKDGATKSMDIYPIDVNHEVLLDVKCLISKADECEVSTNSEDTDWQNESHSNSAEFTEDKKTVRSSKNNSTQKPFPCEDCERSYLSRRALYNHRHQHHKPAQCIKTRESFEDIKSIAENIATNVNRRSLSSRRTKDPNGIIKGTQEKNTENDSDEDLAEDNDTELIKRSHACKDCDRTYKTRGALWNHRNRHHNSAKLLNEVELEDEKPIDLADLEAGALKAKIAVLGDDAVLNPTNAQFSEISEKDDYWKNGDFAKNSDSSDNEQETGKIAKKLYPCKLCDRIYKSHRALWNHRRDHHNPAKSKLSKKQHKCDECDAMFYTAQHLLGHKRKHSGIICDICGKQFTQYSNMMTHRVRHGGVKSYKCEECDCDYTAYTQKELNAHMIRHTGIFPVICEICGSRHRDGGKLKEHMRRHTGERPYKCEVCAKCFFSGHDLIVHSVTHTNERPFKCDSCTSTFRSKKSLRLHKRQHSTERGSFVCKVCDKAFTLSSSLNSHMRSHDAATL